MNPTANVLPTPAPSQGRAGRIALLTLQLLLAAIFIWGGINKLFGFQQEAEITANFAKFGVGPWFRYFVATLELVGGLGLLIPRLAGLAALLLMGVMTGAVITHLTVLPPWQVAFAPAIIGGLLSLIARARWPQTKALLGLR